MKNRLLFALYLLLLFFPLLELALRIIQYQPYRHTPFHIESAPAFCLLPHPRLGFSLNPGTYEVSVNRGLCYQVTHGADSLRISGPQPQKDSLPLLFMMGCSYTYGIGVADSQSSPYVLQQLLPHYQIRNYAVPGYGTVQSYLQLQQAIHRNEVPELVIVNYADFHDERNALSPIFRKTLHMGYERSNAQLSNMMRSSNIPYLANLGEASQVSWVDWGSIYTNWPGREDFSSINFLQEINDRWTRHTLQPNTRTIEIFQQIQQICQVHNIRFMITGLTSNHSTRQSLCELRSLGMETLDISLDLKNMLYNNYPFDSHPNALAHQVFALRIAEYVSGSGSSS